MMKKIILSTAMLSGVFAMAQNTGIGTTNPTEKLEVAGNIKSTTINANAGVATDKVVVADTDGVLKSVPSTSFAKPLKNSTSNIINDTTVERAALTGDVTAAQNTNATTIAPNAVTSAKIADGTIVAADLSSMGATAGQLLQYNGVSWMPQMIVKYTDKSMSIDTPLSNNTIYLPKSPENISNYRDYEMSHTCNTGTLGYVVMGTVYSARCTKLDDGRLAWEYNGLARNNSDGTLKHGAGLLPPDFTFTIRAQRGSWSTDSDFDSTTVPTSFTLRRVSNYDKLSNYSPVETVALLGYKAQP